MKPSSETYIGGIHAVRALLERSPERVLRLYTLSTESTRLQALLTTARELDIPHSEKTRTELDRLLVGQEMQHQGIVALCKPLPMLQEDDLEDLIAQNPQAVFLFLDEIQDPHNLGACLRSANAFGVSAVIAPKKNAASLTPVARKVACGAAEWTPFIQVTNLARVLQKCKDQGMWMVATTMEATTTIDALDLKGRIGIVMGAEGAGLRQLTQSYCDFTARIPLQGSVESLNVSVATGICLYEVQRQRRSG